MKLKPLTKEQYLETMDTPMRFIEADDDSYGPFPIAEYVDHVIKSLSLPTTRKEIDIHHVYMNDSAGFCHILFDWGEANIFVAVVTRPAEKEIHGHYLLDLNSEYELGESEGN